MENFVKGLSYTKDVVTQGELPKIDPKEIKGVDVYFSPIKDAEACFDATFWEDRKVEVLIVFTLAKQADGSNKHLAWKGKLDSMLRMVDLSRQGNDEIRKSIFGQTAFTFIPMVGGLLSGSVVRMWADSSIPGNLVDRVPFDFIRKQLMRIVATPANKEKFIKSGSDLLQNVFKQAGTGITQINAMHGQGRSSHLNKLSGVQEQIAGMEGTAHREIEEVEKSRNKALESAVANAGRTAQAAGGK